MEPKPAESKPPQEQHVELKPKENPTPSESKPEAKPAEPKSSETKLQPEPKLTESNSALDSESKPAESKPKPAVPCTQAIHDSYPIAKSPSKVDLVDCARITGGTNWVGEAVIDGQTMPLSMTIGIRRGKAVTATMVHPNMGDAKTKVEGNINGNKFDFVEKDIVQGHQLLQIPIVYRGKKIGVKKLKFPMLSQSQKESTRSIFLALGKHWKFAFLVKRINSSNGCRSERRTCTNRNSEDTHLRWDIQN